MEHSTTTQLYTGDIVDPHIHLFPLTQLKFDWLSGPNQCIEHPFLKEKINDVRSEYTLKHHLNDGKNQNVKKYIHIQAYCNSAFDEVQYCSSVAEENPELGGIVAFANLMDDPIILEDHLKSISKFSKLRGIRQLLNHHDTREDLRETPTKYEQDPRWIENLGLLEKHGLHYEFHGFPTQLKDLRVVATKFPNMQFVINHAGLIYDIDSESLNLWKKEIEALGAFPNVYIKTSGLHMIHHQLEQQLLNEIVDHIIKSFTVDKVMFASNYPIDKPIISYDDLYNAFKLSVAHHSPEDQHKLFYQNAMKFYRLNDN